MKKISLSLTLFLLLALILAVPAMARTDYGVIYDETEQLGSQYLEMQGVETLPALSETLGLDLRVDVLTLITDDTIGEAAMWIYDTYGYGWGDRMEGATLTILMEPTVDGTYAMPADGWCIYTSLRPGRGDSQALASAIRDAVEPSMAERAWNGEDLTMSATALTQAVDAMAEAAEEYILANCPPEAAAEPEPPEMPEEPETPEVPETAEVPETPEIPAEPEPAEPESVPMEHIFDFSDLLPYADWEELETRARDITNGRRCGVYFVLIDDYTDYGDDVYEVTYQLYHEGQLGFGDNRDGIVVLLSTDNRKYAMFVYGEYAEYVFNTYGQEELEKRFLGFFEYDDWYGGISHYLDACDEFLTRAEAGDPVRQSYWGRFVMAAGAGCLGAGLVCLFLLRGMKSVKRKQEANAYVTEKGLCLTLEQDLYDRTTVSRSKIEKSGSGGSSRSESGGGGSGRSGSF